ncbi:hypothetical protein IAI53_15055 [Thauera sp. CAU 1555]|uniref:Tetratricopeptide repeat protein n=1 Tax=Thauera sedimentorum TaxID=2767595 RepID=A0ABR9BCY4_9RHOO|nr:hypothetical protein [Thauera sedimentorum]MBC9073294.1 hypothetical protein [Thauera sedimentorum]MBD8504213.1 hypothetical protein [Thauera sedimentorum]
MAQSRKRIGALLVCLLLATTTRAEAIDTSAEDEAARRLAWEEEQAENDVRAMFERLNARSEELERRANELPYPDPVTVGIEKPRLDWLEKEKARYAHLLDDMRVDVLLAPVQVQGTGVSRTTRALMAESLAAALPSGVRVAPPSVVARATGDGQRQLERADVIAVANRAHARRIIWTYAGHRFDGRLHLYFEIQDLGERGGFQETDLRRPVSIDPLPFALDDGNGPLQVFRAHLPQILAALDYPAATPHTVSVTPLPQRFPASLGEIAHEDTKPAARALYLQLLAALVPATDTRGRERLYERSLTIAWQMPPAHPTTRLLLARAYHGLHMRPAALAVLAAPASDAERALVAALQGNLPELERLRQRIALSPLRLMAEIDATDMRFAYEAESIASHAERETLLASLPSPWRDLAARRFVASDPTGLNAVDPMPVLDLLGREFPQAGPSPAERIKGRMLAGRWQDTGMEVAIAPYLNPLVAQVDNIPCCAADASGQARATRLDVLDFLVESAIADIVYAARRRIRAQGRYRDGLRALDELDVVFRDHPELLNERAFADEQLARNAEPELQQSLHQRALASRSRAQSAAAFGGLHPSDMPTHIDGPPPHIPGHKGHEDTTARIRYIGRTALAHVTHDSHMLGSVYQQLESAAEREALLQETAGRFDGSSVPPLLLAMLEHEKGRPARAREVLAAAARQGLPSWEVYERLGREYLSEARYVEAATAFNSYPGFSGAARVHPVSRDNLAYRVGSLLYWRGEPDLAAPLYRMAAGSGTGSGANHTSTARLALLAGDYRAAAMAFHVNMRNYDFAWSYRDFFSLMHMLGQGGTAWEGFLITAHRLQVPQLWHAALVGHRREALRPAEYGQWLRDNRFVHAERVEPWVAGYLTLAAVTDRMPSEDALAELGRLPAHETRILLPFAQAYRAIRQHDFAGAEAVLADTLDKIDLRGLMRAPYLLPYYALAAAQAGKTEAARARIDAAKPAMADNMDLRLAIAVLDALSCKPNAPEGFARAFAHRVFAEDRPLLVEYEFADLAMWAHELTGEPAYRDYALKMARFNQRVQPWEAWSHALAALLLEPGEERSQAARRAVYLDPQSAWLVRLPANELDAARAAVRTMPPFILVEEDGTGI